MATGNRIDQYSNANIEQFKVGQINNSPDLKKHPSGKFDKWLILHRKHHPYFCAAFW